ncbi:zinc-binding dehydrogenase [Xylanibacillus composti]|uniref:Alcohol dehydrogenase-like C-terminal domain-containing protein n=1 Tax=Xylanibacillus composti TaxID=1572762 RepID=A0A8J4H382_9BACL|nr:zinc-binding dehydrogenase [Xylanibacillus composti]GIQ67773.1 hypothetical protein XYCOK13_05970 [Xylanibacillus composti]
MAFTDQAGADYVIECAGKSASYDTALKLLRTGGTLLIIGEGAEVSFNSSEIIHKHLTLFGSLYSTMEDGRKVQELMVKGEINPLDLVTHRFPLHELPVHFGKVITFSEGLLKAVVLANES